MRRLAVAGALLLLSAGCVSGSSGTTATPAEAAVGVVAGPLEAISTSGDPSGNRYHKGTGSLPGAPLELAGSSPVAWVLAAEGPDGVVVVSVDEEGAVAGHLLIDGRVEEYELNLTALSAGTPPALAVNDGVLLLAPPPSIGSPLASPLALPSGGLVFVTVDGAVVVTTSTGNRRFSVDPLLDGKVVLSGQGRLAVPSQPTDRYPHGIAGDRLEAAALDLIDLGALEISATVSIPAGRVVEGGAPLWVDLDGDGSDEVVLTLSDARAGARLAVLSGDGDFMAESEPIGQGNRWRHQIGGGPIGPDGEFELVDVRTPHLGGIVEFFRLDGDRLSVSASLAGYSSHAIGSRNLDQALIADADGDGTAEVVVPHQRRTSLAGVQRTASGAEEVWSVELGAVLTSNLAGVATGEGRFVLVAGLADGRVLVWE